MNTRIAIRGLIILIATLGLAAQLGCSKDSDKGDSNKTSTSEASSDSKLLALKFHHDK
jgi:hypothetical protein